MKPETRIASKPGTLDEPNRLYGYAAKFDEPSEIMFDPEVCKGPFVEVIRSGAFTNSLRVHPDVRALSNHAADAVLARTKNGTMKLWEDEIGLAYDLTLPDTSVARDLRESIRRRDLDGGSFGFFVIEDEVELRPGLPAIRSLIEVHVFEITPATAFPAYAASEVHLRSRRTEHAPAPVARPHLGLAEARLRLSRARD
jgi:HK97 family phage prohead protease